MTKAETSPPISKDKKVRKSVGWYVVLVLIGGVLIGLLPMAFNMDLRATLGISDPGTITTFGPPLAKAAGELLACLGVGSSMLTVSGMKQHADSTLGLGGYTASRTGTWVTLGWGLMVLMEIPPVLSDVSSQPLSTTTQLSNWAVSLEQTKKDLAWLQAVIFAGTVALGSSPIRKWIWQPVFSTISLVLMMPLTVMNHNASGGAHDYDTNSYIQYLTSTMFWVGGLMTLVGHACRRGKWTLEAVKRYSFVALVAFIAMSASGLINAAANIGWSDLVSNNYGILALVRAVLTILLSLCSCMYRRTAIPEIERTQPNRPFWRLAIVEVITMALTIGVAVALGHTPPPPNFSEQAGGESLPSTIQMQVKLSYSLEIPSGWEIMFTQRRFDTFFGSAAITATWIYLYWLYLLKKRGGTWSLSNTLWRLAGCATPLFISCSVLGVYMPVLFSVHTIAHMLYSMGTPAMLVPGGLVTLALCALKLVGRDGLSGIREWLVAFISNPVSRFLIRLTVATVQFAVGFYLLCMTSIYDFLADEHVDHVPTNIRFLTSGYIFYWVITSVDAAPQQIEPLVKLVTLVGSLLFHAWFGISLMQSQKVLAETYYASLDLPWAVSLLEDQNVSGTVAWATGEVPLYTVTAAPFVQWWCSDEKDAARYDRVADRNNDEELAAYNEMFACMSQQVGVGGEDERDYHTLEVDVQHPVHMDNSIDASKRRGK